MHTTGHDGDGWAAGPGGTTRWGRYGAAGLLLVVPVDTAPHHPAPDRREPLVLLQHRSPHTASGDTWGLPGGARNSDEDVIAAALRETEEETGIHPADVTVHTTLQTAGPYPADPHRPELAANWTYTVVIATAATALPTVANEESLALSWIPLSQVPHRNLLPAFRESWPQLLQILTEICADSSGCLPVNKLLADPAVPAEYESATPPLERINSHRPTFMEH
ncbi:bifunctional nicotinamide mononucleotide adenylyltransferase/ADP-ribose pyrophosphatase [Corynebacterium choanae]|uniref:Bifunctional nicotinamide mononucleotide adenylyltransferase/ADP-ribose pyrophosphatase n=1 Tax=Corynebacterium choanae TaxID=1862358 RepID=A0A3G6J429_9CORY|nr:bifunctional nicotinamide mononucleotide adenylyltransferase/ADP-ribose pyrophosphatase [Corynebacterium choanae]